VVMSHWVNFMILPLVAFAVAYEFGKTQARRRYIADMKIRHEQRLLTGEVPQVSPWLNSMYAELQQTIDSKKS